MQTKVGDLERIARKFGHELNIKKSKAKHDADSIMLPVEDVDSFCYRGSIVATNFGAENVKYSFYGEVHKYIEELISE